MERTYLTSGQGACRCVFPSLLLWIGIPCYVQVTAGVDRTRSRIGSRLPGYGWPATDGRLPMPEAPTEFWIEAGDLTSELSRARCITTTLRGLCENPQPEHVVLGER